MNTKFADYLLKSVLVLTLVFAVGQLTYNAVNLDTWLDEGNYLMKGYWYISGLISPYSEIDRTGYMPFFFYLVGAAQKIWGIGYSSGRVLAVLFAVGCFVFVYLIGAKIGRTRIAGIAGVVLLAGHHVTLTYFATATPYSLVSFLSLLLVYVLMNVNNRKIAFSVSGLLLWVLVFTRPNMLPVALIIIGWALLIEPRHKLLLPGIAFLAFCFASIPTMVWFGPGLTDVVLTVPGISHLNSFLGGRPSINAGVVALTTSPLDPIVRQDEVFGFFQKYFLEPYALLSFVTLLLITVRFVRSWRYAGERKFKPIDILMMYFWAAVLLHFMLSLSYCVNCITPYTSYFLPIGVLAIAGLVGEGGSARKHSGVVFAIFGLTIAGAVWLQIFPNFPTILRPQKTFVRALATQYSDQIRPHIGAGLRIVVIDPSAVTAQAVWLAGGVVEPRTISLPINYRKPLAKPDTKKFAETEKLLWKAGFWDSATMGRAIAGEYQTVLVNKPLKYNDPLSRIVRDGLPFGDLLDKHYNSVVVISEGGQELLLFRRKD